MHGTIPTLPQYTFMEWCLIKQLVHLQMWYLVKHRETLPLTGGSFPEGKLQLKYMPPLNI